MEISVPILFFYCLIYFQTVKQILINNRFSTKNVFKWSQTNKSYLSPVVRGVARLFKLRHSKGGWEGSGADWDLKWRLSIDPYTKCHFLRGGSRGDWILTEGAQARQAPQWLCPCRWFLNCHFWYLLTTTIIMMFCTCKERAYAWLRKIFTYINVCCSVVYI